MVEEGLFDRFPVDAVYGMHNAPGLPVGSFATRKGPFMAASDSWIVMFRGTGGHGGAGAHLATDPTIVLAQFIMALQTIVSRNVQAIETAVISVGHVAGGDIGSPNIIPSEVGRLRHRSFLQTQYSRFAAKTPDRARACDRRRVWVHRRGRL